jgi:uncharacterized membrane-anchored protein
VTDVDPRRGLRGRAEELLQRRTLLKVPEVTALFWVAKLLTTAMGESCSDWAVHVNPFVAVIVAGLLFTGALALQLAANRYIPWVYWLAVAMIALFGTMVADVIHIVFLVPYVVSSVAFGVALFVVLRTWHRTEGTLSIHTIDTGRREVFYWTTVLTTFAFGTALGDTTAHTLNLGFFTSGVLFAIAFTIPALAYWLVDLDEVTAFWAAYILTRPLGASFADWAGVPRSLGGINLGRGRVTLVLSLLIIAVVAWLSRRDESPRPRRQATT